MIIFHADILTNTIPSNCKFYIRLIVSLSSSNRKSEKSDGDLSIHQARKKKVAGFNEISTLT